MNQAQIKKELRIAEPGSSDRDHRQLTSAFSFCPQDSDSPLRALRPMLVLP
jgi:hypothetical protein